MDKRALMTIKKIVYKGYSHTLDIITVYKLLTYFSYMARILHLKIHFFKEICIDILNNNSVKVCLCFSPFFKHTFWVTVHPIWYRWVKPGSESPPKCLTRDIELIMKYRVILIPSVLIVFTLRTFSCE
mgnify:CR=1 FL=1